MHKTIITALLLITAASAQESPVKVGGEFRVRSEADGRDFRTGTDMNLYTLSRLRLSLEAKPLTDVAVYVRLQDSRTFGEEKDAAGNFNTVANTRNLDLFEAYATVANVALEGLSVRLGRQMMQFGNERVIGALNWNNIGRAFDGLRLTYVPAAGTAVDLFVMNGAETNTPPSGITPASVSSKRDDGQFIAGAFFSRTVSETFLYEAYAVYQNITKRPVPGKDSLDRWTGGARVKGKEAPFFYDAEAALQTGTLNGTDLFAYSAALSAGYETGSDWCSSVSLNLDLLSGTAPSAADLGTFEPPFSTGHKFYGFMDYFTNFQTQTWGRGILDGYLRTVHRPSASLTVTPTLHYFSLMEERSLLVPDRSLGAELDVVVQYRYNPSLVLEGGVCGFLPDGLMRTQYAANDLSTWMYLMATVTF